MFINRNTCEKKVNRIQAKVKIYEPTIAVRHARRVSEYPPSKENLTKISEKRVVKKN